MPLPVLLTQVIGGVAAIAILLHRSGRSRRVVPSPDGALAEWRRHFPGGDPVAARLSADGHAALVLTRTGAGLVRAMGIDTVARPLRDCELTETAAGLTTRLRDFAAPRACIRLDASRRRRWRNLMDPAGPSHLKPATCEHASSPSRHATGTRPPAPVAPKMRLRRNAGALPRPPRQARPDFRPFGPRPTLLALRLTPSGNGPARSPWLERCQDHRRKSGAILSRPALRQPLWRVSHARLGRSRPLLQPVVAIAGRCQAFPFSLLRREIQMRLP